MAYPRLIFNFIGLTVVDWHSAFQFFSQRLGFRYALEPQHGNWAVFGNGWQAYYQDANRSCVCELFDGGRQVAERYWGVQQGLRPGLQVSNLQSVVDAVQVPVALRERPWGREAEFETVEGIRFAFTEMDGMPYSDDLGYPYIGHVAIKCADFEAMKHFYGEVLGFMPIKGDADYEWYQQDAGHPHVILERGGQPSNFDVKGTPWAENAVRAFPVFMSLMTDNIHTVHENLRSQAVDVLCDLTAHEDWGGTDIQIADPDGNALQVVQYHS